MIRLTFLIVCIAAAFFPLKPYADETPRIPPKFRTWLETGEWLPFQPALPANYILRSLDGDEFGLLDGVIWSTPEGVQDHLNNPKATRAGALTAELTDQVTQTGPKSFSNDAAGVARTLKAAGMKDIRVEKYQWGEYPVIAVRATEANGRPLAMAWMGLNSKGATVEFRYWFPYEAASYDSEWAIWERVLKKTTGVSTQELIKRFDEHQHLVDDEC